MLEFMVASLSFYYDNCISYSALTILHYDILIASIKALACIINVASTLLS